MIISYYRYLFSIKVIRKVNYFTRNYSFNKHNVQRLIMATEKGDVNTNENQPPEKQADLKEINPHPDYIESRIKLWEKYKAQYEEALKNKQSEPIKIEVINKDNRVVDGQSWRISPLDVAKQIGPKSWCDQLVISRVNGELWDLERPLEGNCKLELLTFDDDDGKQVFWHSSAHVLGEALERLYGGHLCYGPPIEDGFYYDISMCPECYGDVNVKQQQLQQQQQQQQQQETPNDQSANINTVSSWHFNSIENLMKKICKENQRFERLELSKQQLIDMFSYNKFKVRILNEKVKEDSTTVYRCGTLIDLCRGPHVRHTGNIKAFKVTKSSSSFWEGKADAETLQRVYGISFPDGKQLKEWQKWQEEASKRDHRKVGREQRLFFFNYLSPGSAFFPPHGAYIYNSLIELIREEYRKRGFREVITPNIYNSRLWTISGHWQHYQKNMFVFNIDESKEEEAKNKQGNEEVKENEDEKFGLKPMNCPGHCLMFKNELRSWRDLPIRYADFGVLHRNEESGALTGLTRVRRFQQDDAHIFCALEQLSDEILKSIEFFKAVYSIFGFPFKLFISTRPDDFIGEIEDWNKAEAALKKGVEDAGMDYKINEKDGAFYGPKIDVYVTDAFKRQIQCATVQVDFQLPSKDRFDLIYVAEDGSKKHPVIIHRAVLGSIERFIALITEHYGGKWPFWLSPRQAIVLPIGPSCNEYAENVKRQLYDAGFEAEIESDPGLTINKKVRNAQLAQFNFILVVGEKEMANQSVNVRTRDNKIHGECSVKDLIEKFRKFKSERVLNAEETF